MTTGMPLFGKLYRALGLPLHRRRHRDRGRGGEENPVPLGDWDLGGTIPPTQDATHLFFNGASVDAEAFLVAPDLKDNTPYEIIWKVSGFVAGSVKMSAYGATANHRGSTALQTANGTFTEQVTTGSNGVFTQCLRVTCGEAINTFVVEFVSVREIIAPPAAGDFLVDENGDFLVDENTDFLVG